MNGLYSLNDMVKAGCNDCKGCSDCCRGMGQSIVLDPYDIWQLECNLGSSFAGLLQEKGLIELSITDGLILPNIKMQGPLECCGFLNEKGRCDIHAFRPGLCRLFPLGRNYDGDRLQYFLLEDVCTNATVAKVKIKKWLGIANSGKYEEFLIKWHGLCKGLKEKFSAMELDSDDMEMMKAVNMKFLRVFYETPYAGEDFFGKFEERINGFNENYW